MIPNGVSLQNITRSGVINVRDGIRCTDFFIEIRVQFQVEIIMIVLKVRPRLELDEHFLHLSEHRVWRLPPHDHPPNKNVM